MDKKPEFYRCWEHGILHESDTIKRKSLAGRLTTEADVVSIHCRICNAFVTETDEWI